MKGIWFSHNFENGFVKYNKSWDACITLDGGGKADVKI